MATITASSDITTLQSIKERIQSYKVGNAKQWLKVVIFFFVASVAVNLYSYYDHNTILKASRWKPTWSMQAAKEAEAVAAIDCSGHGDAFLDGILENGAPVCECDPCFKGEDCSQLIPNCIADMRNGDSLFLEPYWKQHASESSVLTSGWHRMSYDAHKGELENNIKLLHETVGNAVITKDTYIIYGNGMHQILNAVTFALSQTINNTNASPAKVVAWVPHYAMFKSQTKYFSLKGYEWKGNASDYVGLENTSDFIEIVTSPNNPDCQLRPDTTLKDALAIYDLAYYWPHYSAIPTAYDKDIMLFTLSKFSGHAGTRFGWALIKDKKVYDSVAEYLQLNTVGVSRDTQLRVFTIIKAIIHSMKQGRDFNEFAFNVMKNRWNALSTLISPSKRFSLQKAEPIYCNYFKSIRDPSPAYGWMKCELEEEEDCAAILEKGGIKAQSGVNFEVGKRYLRLSLVKTQEETDLMMEKLKVLVSTTRRIQNFNISQLPDGDQKRSSV